mmetsp:Transcript_29433/g.54004  ORF Transcript_29433/g.54004 Transcript_29433/m.54004 type:complete len:261 (-) Transcript_29433:562-1344(-)
MPRGRPRLRGCHCRCRRRCCVIIVLVFQNQGLGVRIEKETHRVEVGLRLARQMKRQLATLRGLGRAVGITPQEVFDDFEVRLSVRRHVDGEHAPDGLDVEAAGVQLREVLRRIEAPPAARLVQRQASVVRSHLDRFRIRIDEHLAKLRGFAILRREMNRKTASVILVLRRLPIRSDQQCQNLHGHTVVVQVAIGTERMNGMVSILIALAGGFRPMIEEKVYDGVICVFIGACRVEGNSIAFVDHAYRGWFGVDEISYDVQ